jgi:glucuronate isomerase
MSRAQRTVLVNGSFAPVLRLRPSWWFHDSPEGRPALDEAM